MGRESMFHESRGPKKQHQVQIHSENPGTFQYKSGNMTNKSHKTSTRPDKKGGYKITTSCM